MTWRVLLALSCPGRAKARGRKPTALSRDGGRSASNEGATVRLRLVGHALRRFALVAGGGAAPALDHLLDEGRVDAVAGVDVLAAVERLALGDGIGGQLAEPQPGRQRTPSPKAKASRVPSEGTNANRLAAASETAERITA